MVVVLVACMCECARGWWMMVMSGEGAEDDGGKFGVHHHLRATAGQVHQKQALFSLP